MRTRIAVECQDCEMRYCLAWHAAGQYEARTHRVARGHERRTGHTVKVLSWHKFPSKREFAEEVPRHYWNQSDPGEVLT